MTPRPGSSPPPGLALPADASPASEEQNETSLDGVSPPPGFAGPTLVVWREYGRWQQRATHRAGWVAGMVVAGVVYAGTSQALFQWDAVALGVLFLVMGLVGLLFSLGFVRKAHYFAAGDSWFMSRKGPSHSETGRAVNRHWVRFQDLTSVELYVRPGSRRSKTRLLRMTRSDGRVVDVDLSDLARCAYLVDFLVRRFDACRLRSDVVESLRRHADAATSPCQMGTLVVRGQGDVGGGTASSPASGRSLGG
jgi:hypothetical protein